MSTADLYTICMYLCNVLTASSLFHQINRHVDNYTANIISVQNIKIREPYCYMGGKFERINMGTKKNAQVCKKNKIESD